jgi:hypothetical protein
MNPIFELLFKKGNVLGRMYFTAPNLKTAVEKGKQYCEVRQLKFIFVTQWLHDIDAMINFDPSVYDEHEQCEV